MFVGLRAWLAAEVVLGAMACVETVGAFATIKLQRAEAAAIPAALLLPPMLLPSPPKPPSRPSSLPPTTGDILLFLTGQAEIDKAVRQLNEAVRSLPPSTCGDLIVLPIYAALPPEMQVCVCVTSKAEPEAGGAGE
jgi:hypothetical protein